MHLIVVGGVAAGSKAAARARRVNPHLTISLYQDENEVSYTACGQPYYLSGQIKSRDALVIRRPEDFAKENIQVHVRHRVIELNTNQRYAKVKNLERDQIDTVRFDRLILATGARAMTPHIPGIGLTGVVTLRSMAELDRFTSCLTDLQPQQAVIVGSGYIALEVAESLHELGIDTTLLVRGSQLFSRLDAEMSRIIYDHLTTKGVNIILDQRLEKILGEGSRVTEILTDTGSLLPAQLVVLAMGATANTDLAEQAGLKIGETGAIFVNEKMETSVEGIYAAGDCVESYHRVSGQAVWQPLGDIANLQGRVAGENAAGGNASFPGVFGTAIFKTFDLNVGMTGLTEKAAAQAGFKVVTSMITARDKARYYPGAREVTIKLIAEQTGGRLLGAQVMGSGAVDKMTDIAATALLGNLTCPDLENADLAYAPPFSPVLSPIIVAAAAVNKKLDNLISTC